MRFYKAFFAAALLVGCIYAAPSDINSANGVNLGTKSPANSAAQSVNSANFADSTATGGGILDKIFPENYQATPAKTYELGTVEITAATEPDANPTITTISKDDIEKTSSTNMGQALRFTEGLFFSPGTYRSTIYMRGQSEDTIGFYLDGIPISDTYRSHASSFTDTDVFSTFGLSQIQISKGYVSPSFASYNLGGAINMVTSVPTKDLEFALKYTFISDNENRLDTQIGRNFGDSYFQLTYSQMDRKSLQYSYDYAIRLKENGFDIDGTRKSFRLLSGKYGWFMGEDHEYSINFRYQKQKMNGGWNFINYDATTLYLLGDSKFTDWFSLNSRVYYHMNLNATEQSQIYDDFTTGFIETANFKLTDDQSLKFGVNLKVDSHKQKSYVNSTTYQVDSKYRNKHRVLNTNEFLEYAIRFNDTFRLVVNGGYERQDPISLQAKWYSDRRTDGAEIHSDRKLHLDGWSLQAILYVQPTEWALFHANVGRKSNIPNFSNFYSEYGEYATSSDIRTETAINYELGSKFDFQNIQFGATGYYQDLQDMLIDYHVDKSLCPAGVAGKVNYCYMYDNADTGYIYGVEAFFKQSLLDERLIWGVNYSYTQRRSYNYDNSGTRTDKYEFTTHPRQNINGTITIAPRKEYDVSVSGSVQTSRYARVNIGTNADPIYDYVHIPTVVYFDLSANYYLKDNLKLSLGAYNLFDKNYNYNSSTSSAYTGGLPGRRVFTSVEYRY